MFNVSRLELARKRRRYTARNLAERANVAPVTLSRVVNRQQVADEMTIEKLITALDFPRAFFFKDDVDPIDVSAASFRSLTAMTARERDAALAAGSLAYEMTDWVRARFNLPLADLLDLSHERDPAGAARTLRQYWAIGEKPIGNMIKLLETKGIRVFSLSENTRNVDAFSRWRNGEPYVFLNTFKSTEHSRFDAAHEQRWGVSVAALAHRLHRLRVLTDWQYRTFCIQINRTFGNSEPDGLAPERSSVWQTVLTELWKEGVARHHIASDLSIPDSEMENLLFGLMGDVNAPARSQGKAALKMVK